MNKMVNVIKSLKYQLYQVRCSHTNSLFHDSKRPTSSTDLEVGAVLIVWSLTTLTSGDLAAGCSDNTIWIFSRSEERFATKGVVENYEETLLEIRKNKEQKR
jgi:hypothetical protein